MQRLKLAQIRTDGGTQTRAEVSPVAVQEYADALLNEVTLPPVTVFYDGSEYWLADGFHRYRAHKQIEWLEIDADVKQGTRRDAILYSVGANSTHGLRRTNADKRRAVETLLRDEEWGGNSDNWIAAQCGVSHPFVGKMRAEFAPLVTVTSERRSADGRTMNTANIGKRPAPIPDYDLPAHAPSMARGGGTFPSIEQHAELTPAPWPPPFDPDTGEVLETEPQINLPERIPTEVYDAGQREMPQETLHTRLEDALRQSGGSARADELRRALSRVLEFEREGPAILGTPYAQQMGTYRLARELQNMLAGWLENEPTNAQGQHVITLDAELLLT